VQEVSSGGRPAVAYSFNAAYRLAFTLYTNEFAQQEVAHAAVVNLFGEVVEEERLVLDKITEHSFDGIIRKMLDKYPVIQSICIGMPGLVNQGRIEAVDYAAFDGAAFAGHLRRQFQVPVVFENDVNAAVLGYCMANHCADQTVVGLYLPERYPVGAGILINGAIYRGKDGFAGEAKYLPAAIDWNDPAAVTENIAEALQHLIITFTCLLNPDRIVLYRKSLTAETRNAVLAACQERIPGACLPAVIASTGFDEDYANGIKQIALKPYEPLLK
jgi:predicted NBD/HSP70 family sugar kinase